MKRNDDYIKTRDYVRIKPLAVFRYLHARKLRQRSSNRIVMTLMIKDEEDIIEDNIRHHHSIGVSAFVITDDSSTDQTRNILERLYCEFDMTIL